MQPAWSQFFFLPGRGGLMPFLKLESGEEKIGPKLPIFYFPRSFIFLYKTQLLLLLQNRELLRENTTAAALQQTRRRIEEGERRSNWSPIMINHLLVDYAGSNQRSAPSYKKAPGNIRRWSDTSEGRPSRTNRTFTHRDDPHKPDELIEKQEANRPPANTAGQDQGYKAERPKRHLLT